jgi:rRNA maturation RNase YbeY
VVEVRNETAERVDEAGIVTAVERVLEDAGADEAEVAVLLVDETEMARLNGLHRGRAEVTDVLAFPIDADDDLPAGLPRMLGDVVVCPAQAARQAAEAGVERGEELATLVVHGALHLLGHDHETDDGEMLRRQDAIRTSVDAVGWSTT